MTLQPFVPPAGGLVVGAYSRAGAPLVPPGGPTPLWWVERLWFELKARQKDHEFYRRYVDGDHDNPTLSEAASIAFKRIAGLSKTNLTGLIVETTAERLTVQGFRFGDNAADDVDAWRIWQENDFDAQSETLISTALAAGRAFITVEAPAADGLSPRLYAEDPDQVIVAYAAGNRRQRLAALKVFGDEWTGDRFATLILPDGVYKFRQRSTPLATLTPSTWTLRDPDIEVEPNPLRTVPVFELRTRPQLDGSVRSEIFDVIEDQDACNHIALNALIAAEYGAFKQKWASGIDIPIDPVTKKPVETFDIAVNRMFTTKNADARFGDFDATSLDPYINFYESRVKHMAAVSQTPVSVLLGATENVAAEALALTISGHVDKVRRRQKHYEQPFEDALRCAFLTLRDPRAFATSAETVWVDPEIHSWAETGDMASKLVPNTVTPQMFQEKYLGMTSVERARDQSYRDQNNTLAQLAGVLAGQNVPLPGDVAAVAGGA